MSTRMRSPGRRSTYRYRLNGTALWEKAKAAGDTSQRAIAKRAQVDETSLSRLLEGMRSPSLETLISLAVAYGGPIEDLITAPDGKPLRIPAQVVRTTAAV